MRTRKQTAWRATLVYLAIVAVGIAITHGPGVIVLARVGGNPAAPAVLAR